MDQMYNHRIDTFQTKYKVLEKIGEGSFSEVLKCMHKSTGFLYAAKRLKKVYKHESSISTCAEIVASQKDSFTGQVTFIFELMDMSLYDHFKVTHKPDGKIRGLSEQKSKEYLYQVLRGLEHLHRSGLFHRDVKPENILIKFPSIDTMRLKNMKTHEIIKLADLGSVRGIYSEPPYTEYISTRWYRSPECLLSNGNYGPKMDVWAAGCVFYEMLTYSILIYECNFTKKYFRLLPMFPGDNEIDQLDKIHQVFGTPSTHFLNKLKSRSKNCVVFPKKRGTGIGTLLLPHMTTRQAKAVLELMLEYDPDKRVNIRRLLKNSYFDDIRYKFEPITMEGHQPKPQVYNKKNLILNQKVNRIEYSEESRKRSHSKGSTPSIEIPYYTTNRTNSGKPSSKPTALPLVDYQLSRYMENNRVSSSESTKSCGLGKMSSIRKSVEIILKASRNSESSKQPSSKEKVDSRKLHSKSLVNTTKKKGYYEVHQPFIKAKMPKYGDKI
ncbi:unnamed protein product [Ceutorhynchus assimilis]|uniref:Protein kinase domain-containing protein n=1 Tax=Ceutorhynchus assimilis TaxID=467358 RepID=A0A9N9MLA5_9CUCU|nr:unnamed protein product [Ceutorhynchus assimilis]